MTAIRGITFGNEIRRDDGIGNESRREEGIGNGREQEGKVKIVYNCYDMYQYTAQ